MEWYYILALVLGVLAVLVVGVFFLYRHHMNAALRSWGENRPSTTWIDFDAAVGIISLICALFLTAGIVVSLSFPASLYYPVVVEASATLKSYRLTSCDGAIEKESQSEKPVYRLGGTCAFYVDESGSILETEETYVSYRHDRYLKFHAEFSHGYLPFKYVSTITNSDEITHLVSFSSYAEAFDRVQLSRFLQAGQGTYFSVAAVSPLEQSGITGEYVDNDGTIQNTSEPLSSKIGYLCVGYGIFSWNAAHTERETNRRGVIWALMQ